MTLIYRAQREIVAFLCLVVVTIYWHFLHCDEFAFSPVKVLYLHHHLVVLVALAEHSEVFHWDELMVYRMIYGPVAKIEKKIIKLEQWRTKEISHFNLSFIVSRYLIRLSLNSFFIFALNFKKQAPHNIIMIIFQPKWINKKVYVTSSENYFQSFFFLLTMMVIIMGDVLWFCDMAIKYYIIFSKIIPSNLMRMQKKTFHCQNFLKERKKRENFHTKK